MLKSFSFAKVLSRIGVRGAVLDTSAVANDGTAPKYEGFIPLLGRNNKLHPSVVGAGSIPSGTVKAEEVAFVTAPEKDGTVTNVRDAINNITKDTGGLALLRANNLTDLADSDVAFNGIKIGAAAFNGTTVAAGVVGVARQTDVEAGTNVASDPASGTTYLAVTPTTAKAVYLSKLATDSQTMAGPLVLSGAPTVDLSAATKKYVDDNAATSIPLNTGKMVWVDSVNGDDSTAERAKEAKPCLTLGAAKALATSGDTIVVRPGTYNENYLAKNGVTWFFLPGAKVLYSSGGTSNEPVFNVSSSMTCNVLGYGEFLNMHVSASNRAVLYVQTGGFCTFEATSVQSARTAIVVDTGSTGYARIRIRNTLKSEDGTGAGDSAARLISGICNLQVDGEIYSAASVNQQGLYIGGDVSAAGYHTVKCPKIHGKYNAIKFGNAYSAQVITDLCSATDGSAVKVSGGAQNTLQVTGELVTSSASSPTITMTAGKLTLLGTRLYSNNGTSGVYLNGTSGSPTGPYLVINNSELWSQGTTETMVTANVSGAFKMRIVGVAQSDCAEPTDVTRVGGVWDYVPYADTYYA